MFLTYFRYPKEVGLSDKLSFLANLFFNKEASAALIEEYAQHKLELP